MQTRFSFKTVLSICVSLLFLGLYFTGCNKNDSDNNCEISFSWWGNDERTAYTLKGIELFEKENPSIKVATEYYPWKGYEKIYSEKIAENQETDVMQINFDWLNKFSSDGNGYYNLYDLDDEIELHNFTNADLKFGVKKEKLNAIPTAFNSLVPVWDATIFEKYNLKIPSTWDDFFTVSSVLSRDGIYTFGTTEKHMFLLLIANFEQIHTKRVFMDDGRFNLNADDVSHMLNFYKKLFDQHIIYPDLKNFGNTVLATEDVAGIIGWGHESSGFANSLKKRGDDAFLGDFISEPGAVESGWYLKPATMYAIKKNCENPRPAAKLVNFLLNNPQMALLQKCEKGIPASNKSLTVLMEEKKLDTLEYESMIKIRFHKGNINKMIPIMENPDVIRIFLQHADMFKNGESSIKESSTAICREIREITF